MVLGGYSMNMIAKCFFITESCWVSSLLIQLFQKPELYNIQSKKKIILHV